jgi:GAF domain-containing protein
MSPTPDSTLADPQQIIADLQRANAEMQQRLDEAQAREAATAEVLGLVNSSPGDLAPVFDAMLEKAHSLCGAALGSLVHYDGEHLRAVATRGYPDEYAALARQGAPAHLIGSFERLLGGEPFVQIADLAAFTASDPITHAAIEIAGVRTMLIVPLRKEDALLGYISAQRQEVRPFSEHEIALLQNFAAQAVIAMENARLITETREALEQQTATAEVLGVINSSPGDLAPVFNAMLEKAMRLCEAAFGLMFTIEGGSARIVAERDMPKAFSDYLKAQPPSIDTGSFFGRAVLECSILHTADLTAGEFYRQRTPLSVAAVDLGGVRALLMAPLVKDNAALGVFGIFRPEARPFSDKQVALLQNFAAQAVIAMENARLITETREALEQQTATAEILRVISSSPTDVQPTFDAIAASATRICGAANGNVFRFDGSLIHLGAIFGYRPGDLEAVASVFPIPPSRQTATARAILTRDVVHIVDPKLDPDFSYAQLTHFGTVLSVPMLRDSNPVGAITVTRNQVEAFS